MPARQVQAFSGNSIQAQQAQTYCIAELEASKVHMFLGPSNKSAAAFWIS
jgi:hypothetical protein